MSKWLLLGLVLVIGFISLVVKQAEGDKPVIGILQTASHPALDQALNGFIDGFVDAFGDEYELRIQNAEGQIPQAHLVAASFHRDPNVKAIYTIATPATQAMAHAEREKPIVFAAVTDSAVLGIPQSQLNVTGCQDRVDVEAQADLVCEIAPDTKTVALLYNPSEVNSVMLAGLQRAAFEQRGVQVIDVGMYSEAEAATAASDAARRADVIVTPTDNMVASTIRLISKAAQAQDIPLITSDKLLIEMGATAACGVDYYESGQEAAQMMLERMGTGRTEATLR